MKNDKKYFLGVLVIVFLCVMAVFYFYQDNFQSVNQPGPHGGKLLLKGAAAVEVVLYEKSGAPRFHVYFYEHKKAIHPRAVSVRISLKRFNDEVETIEFEPVNDYLQSKQEIAEPHSFDVVVNATWNKQAYAWQYETSEGRVTLLPELIKSAGIKIAKAGSAVIEKKLSVIGKVSPNGDALSPIYPRFAGIVKELKKKLGDTVEKGEVIAVVESNESLRNYPITAPIAGTIVQKYVIVGEMIKEDKAIYQVTDLSTVWADLTLYRKEAPLIKKGMPAVVSGDNGIPQEAGVIDYISPLGIEDSQTILARTILLNAHQEWIPGMYVNAVITYFSKEVPVAVALSALQRWRGLDVVFVSKGDSFEATPVILGEKSGGQVEVLRGLKPGQSYVIENSFLLKAELGKSEASHDD